jgi:replication factor C subunit 2/4
MSGPTLITTPVGSNKLPWVEAYRPKKLDDISSHSEIVRSLSNSLKSGSLPHLLFYGPPGTGKTSTILALARELYSHNNDIFRSRVLELNASDERGIAVIREKVKTFANTSVSIQTVTLDNGQKFTLPPFKLIILDEADSLTNDAQSALRRTMELYSRVTRFCILCNYVSKIIEPIASRCTKFHFSPLPIASIHSRLNFIIEKEQISFINNESKETVINTIIQISNGDMRKAITFLQSAADLYNKQISSSNISEISNEYPTKNAVDIVQRIKANSSPNTLISYDLMRKEASNVIASGYNINSVVEKLLDAIIFDAEISNFAKALIAEKFAVLDKRLVDVADEELQLCDALLFTSRALSKVEIPSDNERRLVP